MVLSHHISDQLLVMFRLAPGASEVTSIAAQHRETFKENSVHLNNLGVEKSPTNKNFFCKY